VLGALNKDKYEGRDIFIDKVWQWHLHGLPANPERALRGVDLAFNALHGHYGSDGQVQRLLAGLSVPHTGPSAFESATAYNRPAARQLLVAARVKVPHGAMLDADKITDLEATALNIFRSLPQPSVVRPVAGGAGTTMADSYHALVWALKNAIAHSKKILIEELVTGREAVVGVVDQFRNEEHYGLLPHPGTFTHDEQAQLVDAARQVHKALRLKHYSQVHLVLSRRGIYFADVVAHPHLHEDTYLHKSLQDIGAPLPHFLDHVITLAKR